MPSAMGSRILVMIEDSMFCVSACFYLTMNPELKFTNNVLLAPRHRQFFFDTA